MVDEVPPMRPARHDFPEPTNLAPPRRKRTPGPEDSQLDEVKSQVSAAGKHTRLPPAHVPDPHADTRCATDLKTMKPGSTQSVLGDPSKSFGLDIA